ncbi:MAG: hypothetical protein ABL901_10355 [Hyphomicrobiaceae bacterium]
MTRTEAIAAINAKLSSLDDERVLTVAGIVNEIAATDELPRTLTPRELALIMQSKTDFETGRTYTVAESRAYIDEALARRREQRAKG